MQSLNERLRQTEGADLETIVANLIDVIVEEHTRMVEENDALRRRVATLENCLVAFRATAKVIDLT